MSDNNILKQDLNINNPQKIMQCYEELLLENKKLKEDNKIIEQELIQLTLQLDNIKNEENKDFEKELFSPIAVKIINYVFLQEKEIVNNYNDLTKLEIFDDEDIFILSNFQIEIIRSIEIEIENIENINMVECKNIIDLLEIEYHQC